MPVDRRKLLIRGGQILAIAVVGIAALVSLAPAEQSTSYRATGAPRSLPSAQLTPVDADEFDGILVGLRGTPVVVNVWASWCPPCRAEMPLLERAAADYAGEIVFLGVASKDSREEAADFLDEVDVTYTSVFDVSGQVRSSLGLRGFPTTYLFDAHGDLIDAVVGGITEPQLAARLEDLVR